MIIVIDVGNTNIVVGAFSDNSLIRSWRMSTDFQRSSDETGIFFSQLLAHSGLQIRDIEAVVVSSVVPQIMFSLERAIKRYLRHAPIIISKNVETGLNIKVDNPGEVGADRIVNAVAVHNHYPGDSIIIDFGTATTFCALRANGDYLGGVICPGIKIALDALIEKTAKLPKIELIRPEKVIGTNTITSMQSGIIYGYAGQIESIVNRMKAELGPAQVIATGGVASLIKEATDVIEILDPNLTLKGLKLLYDMNK
ncbi:MAG: type III pantothenate kinase [Clostridia bacterium]|nr:type III pantothenate kinase [Clostridia bacterium]